MLTYYRDRTDGTYLAVDHSTAEYYRSIGQPNMREARAVAIAGQRSSVCTTSVSVEWLEENCSPVFDDELPAEWREVL